MMTLFRHLVFCLGLCSGVLFPAALPGADKPRNESDARKPPNVLVILADDMGFSDLGCYGGDVETPNLNRLAQSGLRFTQFYNTARCWPTRSALMTGYYAQQVRMDPPRGRLPVWARLVPHYLKPAGYRCYHSGKWHVPGAPKILADGGFDHSYVLNDHNRFFNPKNHARDDQPLPAVKPGSGYYAPIAFADHAITCLKEHAQKYPDRPFFQYLAFTSPHFPLHALPQDIARYRDRYLKGWDAIREERLARLRKMGIVHCGLSDLQPDIIPRWNLKESELKKRIGPGEAGHAIPWEKLTAEQKRFQATKMAIHAAMVDRIDREIGRVLDQIRAMGAFEDTVVFFASDNGASAEQMIRGDGHDPKAPPGSAKSFLCLGPGWSTAANTPLRLHKTWVHEGGISTPLIVHWPKGIKARGELRHDVGHVIDLVPTLVDLAGVKWTEEWKGAKAPPLPGRSLVPAFSKDGSVAREELFFHHDGHRALRMGAWKVVSLKPDGDDWELYDLATDRCEKVNLATRHPDRVRQMAARWNNLEKLFRQQAGPATPKKGGKAGKK
jgi:arylsulfatase A-like enzyme